MITIGAAGCTAASSGGDGVYTMTAGTNSSISGFIKTPTINFGSITPNTFKGVEILGIYGGVVVNIAVVIMSGAQPIDFWDMIEITGTFTGGTNPRTVQLPRAALNYQITDGNAQWQIAGGVSIPLKMISGNVYDVTIE